MSAVTLDGRLYMIEQEKKAFKGEDAVRFLKHLMAPHPRQVARRMGRLADPSRTGRKGFPGRRSGFSGATGATTRLRSGAQPRRGDLEAPQVCRVEEPLLPESRGVEGRATQGQGALETQKGCHPRLHKAARIRGLDVCAEISKYAYRYQIRLSPALA